MNASIGLRWTKIVWKTDLALGTADATRVRGFLGQRWQSVTNLHHHAANGRVIYQHPLIQTKVLNGDIVITGLAEGAMILEVLPNPGKLSLAQRVLDVVEEERESRIVPVGPTEKLIEYSFVTSWLPLNQANHVKYLTCSSEARSDLLSRILIGNLLSLSKTIRLNVQTRLEPRHSLVETESVQPKGVELLGFTGTCAINFSLPDFWGIGKFSSRGFGTLLRRQLHGKEIG
jgi:hypothetical protein